MRGYDVTGVDVSASMIAQAERTARAHGAILQLRRWRT